MTMQPTCKHQMVVKDKSGPYCFEAVPNKSQPNPNGSLSNGIKFWASMKKCMQLCAK